jgi:hypothetical protein
MSFDWDKIEGELRELTKGLEDPVRPPGSGG